MTIFNLCNVPSSVSLSLLESKIQLIQALPIFSDKDRVTLTYIGGITNHGLKVEELELFLRIPGGNSDVFIDREREKQTLALLAKKGFYSKEVMLFTEGELSGYKVEPFLEGDTLQFIDFYQHQFQVLPILKDLHDSKIQFSYNYDVFEKLLSMINTIESYQKCTIPLLKEKELVLLL